MRLTVGSLFSGIGGLDYGLELAGMTVVWQSEIDPYASRVLAKHWPHVPNLGDITAIDWSTVERPDLICGGYPCQPFSLAGVRRGAKDPRHLWPHFANAIRVLRPRLALLENVPGHLSLGFGRVLGDLAELGYDTEWDCIPAAAVGAPHLRYRVFVVAYARAQAERGVGDGRRVEQPEGGEGGHDVECAECHGTGSLRGQNTSSAQKSGPPNCYHCNGQGKRWQSHDAWRPGHTLDPFGGSGTTAVAAALEGRDATLIDLDARNIDLVRRRLADGLRIVTEQVRVRQRGTPRRYRNHRRTTVHPLRVTWTVDTRLPAHREQVTGQSSIFDLELV